MTANGSIEEQRERYRAQATKWQRLAYLLYGVATIFFLVGMLSSFRPWLVTMIVGSLIVASIILAIAIQVSYAVRGAERHEEDARAQRRRR